MRNDEQGQARGIYSYQYLNNSAVCTFDDSIIITDTMCGFLPKLIPPFLHKLQVQ